MKVIFISGPYRAANHWEIERNIFDAREWAAEIWSMGAVAYCPHANTAHFDGLCPDDVWLGGNLEMLRRCDAILMMKLWRVSEGACAERELAITMGLPVFYSLCGITNWLIRCDRESDNLERGGADATEPSGNAGQLKGGECATVGG